MDALLAVAAVISSITVPFGVVSIAAIRFAKKLRDEDREDEERELQEERDAADLETKEEREAAALEAKIKREALALEKRTRLEEVRRDRLEKCPYLEIAGKQERCPFCNEESAVLDDDDDWDESKWSVEGFEIMDGVLEDPLSEVANECRKGPSSPVLVTTVRGPRLWQYCCTCGGMWLARPSTLSC